MNVLEDTLWLGGQASGFLVVGWPVTLALIVALGLVITWKPPRLSVSNHWLPVLLVLFPVTILGWGALARHEGQSSMAPTWVEYVIVGLLVAQLIGTIVVAYACRERRLFALVVGACFGWWSWANAMVSSMAVTGDWL